MAPDSFPKTDIADGSLCLQICIILKKYLVEPTNDPSNPSIKEGRASTCLGHHHQNARLGSGVGRRITKASTSSVFVQTLYSN